MAAVTICSDFEPPKIKSDTVSPSIFHEVTIGSDFGAQKIKSDTVSTVSSWSSFSECWALSQLFHSPLSLSSRGFLVVSSAYLRLLIFLPAILIPAYASSSLAFHMMYSAYKLNKHGEGNGNPLQYSCLENPVDIGAWWAAVQRVAQSRTRLKRLSMHVCVGEGNGNPLQYSCLENPHGQRSLVGYSP